MSAQDVVLEKWRATSNEAEGLIMGLLILLAAIAVPVSLVAAIIHGIRNTPEDDDEDSTYITVAIPFLEEC